MLRTGLNRMPSIDRALSLSLLCLLSLFAIGARADGPLSSSAIAGSSLESGLPLADYVVVNKTKRVLQLMRAGEVLRSYKIALGLLSHANRDRHTSRSFEIPACGGFMLAERTAEHQHFFAEDREAVYFDTFDEMMDKIRYYLRDDAARTRIAAAGHRRCLESGYRYVDRARELLRRLRA